MEAEYNAFMFQKPHRVLEKKSVKRQHLARLWMPAKTWKLTGRSPCGHILIYENKTTRPISSPICLSVKGLGCAMLRETNTF